MKPYKTLIFLLLVVAILAGVCYLFPEDGVPFGNRRLFFPTIDEVIGKKESMSVTEKMAELEATIRLKAVADSIQTAEHNARQDSIRFYQNFFDTHKARFYLPNGDYGFFDELFEAMEQSKAKRTKVHILHYGDSQIEEDRISSTLRQRLQEQFGGRGTGLLPIMQPIPSASVSQSATGAMERFILAGMHKARAESNRYGVLAQFATLAGSGGLSVRSQNYSRTYDGVKSWSEVKLFVIRNSTPFSATLSAGGFSEELRIDSAQTAGEVLRWKLPESVRKIHISFSGTAELSAVSLEGSYGVNVDNVPIRGASGTFFTQIDRQSMRFATRELNVRLVILEFGGNMMPSITQKNMQTYSDQLSRQIAYFKDVCPNAKILLIGPADMSKKVRGVLQTYPLLPELVETMKQCALQNGAAFWNMFDMMGGENSMIEWVAARPALAASDYIHFTPRGAERIGEMLYESLWNYYEYYKMMKR